jgi:hypothetical protein
MTDQDLRRHAETNPAAPLKLKITERRIMALNLRKQGASYRIIAANMRQEDGISPKYNSHAAYLDVMAALNDLNEQQRELAKENQRLDLERLDTLFTKAFENGKKGDVMSINACLAIMDKRAKLLGYQPPEVQQNLNIDVSKLTTEQLLRIKNGENPTVVLASG